MERLDYNDLNKYREEINGYLFENINKETYEIKEKSEKIIPDIKQTPLQANCRLEMHIESENKVIYVRQCRAQYFLISSLKCCDNVNIKYIGANYNERFNEIYGAIGNYYILNAGILLVPKRRIRPGAIDILPFVAYDGDTYYRFEAVFNYVPYQCLRK